MAGNPLLVCVEDELTQASFTEIARTSEPPVLLHDSLDHCCEALSQHLPSALLLDLSQRPKRGLQQLQHLRQSGNDLPVVVICAADDIRTARAAFALSASDVVYLPLQASAMLCAVRRALRARRLQAEVNLRRRMCFDGLEDFVGASATLDALKHQMGRLREVDAPAVLITGESGTGKDVVTRALHAHGPRHHRPLLTLDCSGLSDESFLRQLLGEASPGSTTPLSRGLLELADGGIVVLDRISDLSLTTQEAVEHCLATRTFTRLNSESAVRFNTALFATTTRSLQAEVEAGRFHRALYLRLGATSLHLPPLRERTTDIPLLVEHFLTQASNQHGLERLTLTPQALELLRHYRWPGNIRELRNLLERLVILQPSPLIKPEHLPPEVRHQSTSALAGSLEGCPFVLPADGINLDLVERGLISQALQSTGGNQSAAARMLGISRYALRYRMEKHELTG